MKKIITAICLFFLIPALWGQTLTVNMEVKTSDFQNSCEFLDCQSQNFGGYSVFIGNKHGTFKVPILRADDFISSMGKKGIKILSVVKNTENTDEKLKILEARLSDKNYILEKYYDALKNADFQVSLEIEKALLNVISEKENILGKIQFIKEAQKMALFEIDFHIPEKNIQYENNIALPWIKHIEFKEFMSFKNHFSNPELKDKKPYPAGFATETDERNIYRSVSNDGCRFAKEKQDNYPLKSADFWSGVLELEFRQLGYTIAEKEEYMGKYGKVYFYSWNVPGKTCDYSYIVGFTVNEKKILSVACGGEKNCIEKYYPEVKKLVLNL